jgi:hypothetical protein
MPKRASDLRARGLLDDTLVIWGGEFGRTPASEGPKQVGQIELRPAVAHTKAH